MPRISYGLIPYTVVDEELSATSESGESDDDIMNMGWGDDSEESTQASPQTLPKEDCKIQKKRFLLIKRKDSIGMINFIQGKYRDMDSLRSLISQMTKQELESIKTQPFEEIWKQVWAYHSHQLRKISCSTLSHDTVIAKRRYENKALWMPIVHEIVNNGRAWIEPEWGFPKGGKMNNENPKECAIREFEEETGFSRNDIEHIDEKYWKEEIYDSGQSFQTIYYSAKLKTECLNKKSQTQNSEIGGMRWMTSSEALKSIRSYHKDRIRFIESLSLSVIGNSNLT